MSRLSYLSQKGSAASLPRLKQRRVLRAKTGVSVSSRAIKPKAFQRRLQDLESYRGSYSQRKRAKPIDFINSSVFKILQKDLIQRRMKELSEKNTPQKGKNIKNLEENTESEDEPLKDAVRLSQTKRQKEIKLQEDYIKTFESLSKKIISGMKMQFQFDEELRKLKDEERKQQFQSKRKELYPQDPNLHLEIQNQSLFTNQIEEEVGNESLSYSSQGKEIHYGDEVENTFENEDNIKSSSKNEKGFTPRILQSSIPTDRTAPQKFKTKRRDFFLTEASNDYSLTNQKERSEFEHILQNSLSQDLENINNEEMDHITPSKGNNSSQKFKSGSTLQVTHLPKDLHKSSDKYQIPVSHRTATTTLPKLKLKNDYLIGIKEKLDSIYNDCQDFALEKRYDPEFNFAKVAHEIGFHDKNAAFNHNQKSKPKYHTLKLLLQEDISRMFQEKERELAESKISKRTAPVKKARSKNMKNKFVVSQLQHPLIEVKSMGKLALTELTHA